ncbi:MAG: SDR family NAD(P)-dependent oxidoreductase [Proteobacteria bacterium]|nr:SDR family NAD(P)-dependent oxidoreductase [Pseudomonadota bacterium]
MDPDGSNDSKEVCLITGVGPGTGSALARRFAEGYRVALLARNAERLEALAGELEGAVAFPCDVADEAQLSATVDRIRHEMGDPSVNCERWASRRSPSTIRLAARTSTCGDSYGNSTVRCRLDGSRPSSRRPNGVPSGSWRRPVQPRGDPTEERVRSTVPALRSSDRIKTRPDTMEDELTSEGSDFRARLRGSVTAMLMASKESADSSRPFQRAATTLTMSRLCFMAAASARTCSRARRWAPR